MQTTVLRYRCMLGIFSMALCINVAALGVQTEEKHIEETLGQSTSNHRVKRGAGVITGAVIGGIFTVATAAASYRPNYGSGDKGGCKWLGTAPFCVGGCTDNDGMTAELRSSGHGWVNGRLFGELCWSGQKDLCCRSKADNNVWDGIWENHLTNDKLRCTAYKTNNACGAKLLCHSDSISYTWNFNIVGSHCNVLETMLANTFNGCKGDAHYGLIIFRPHTGNCGIYFNAVKYYKVE